MRICCSVILSRLVDGPGNLEKSGRLDPGFIEPHFLFFLWPLSVSLEHLACMAAEDNTASARTSQQTSRVSPAIDRQLGSPARNYLCMYLYTELAYH